MQVNLKDVFQDKLLCYQIFTIWQMTDYRGVALVILLFDEGRLPATVKREPLLMILDNATWYVSAFLSSAAGWLGTLSYLLAYLLLSINKLKVHQQIYHVLNIIGALGLTCNALVLKDYPNIIVNVCWALIASWAIFNIQQAKRS